MEKKDDNQLTPKFDLNLKKYLNYQNENKNTAKHQTTSNDHEETIDLYGIQNEEINNNIENENEILINARDSIEILKSNLHKSSTKSKVIYLKYNWFLFLNLL